MGGLPDTKTVFIGKAALHECIWVYGARWEWVSLLDLAYDWFNCMSRSVNTRLVSYFERF